MHISLFTCLALQIQFMVDSTLQIKKNSTLLFLSSCPNKISVSEEIISISIQATGILSADHTINSTAHLLGLYCSLTTVKKIFILIIVIRLLVGVICVSDLHTFLE